MPTTHDQGYCPHLEVLEERCVPAPLIPFLPVRPASLVIFGSRSIVPLNGGSALAPTTETAPPPQTVAVAPTPIGVGIFDRPARVTPRPLPAGLFVRGMPLVFTRQTDAGLSLPGIRLFSPVQLPRAAAISGFQLTPGGVLFA